MTYQYHIQRDELAVSVLTIPAALALSLQCAPSVDPHMIVAIGQHESGLDPLTIHDNTTGRCCTGRVLPARRASSSRPGIRSIWG